MIMKEDYSFRAKWRKEEEKRRKHQVGEGEADGDAEKAVDEWILQGLNLWEQSGCFVCKMASIGWSVGKHNMVHCSAGWIIILWPFCGREVKGDCSVGIWRGMMDVYCMYAWHQLPCLSFLDGLFKFWVLCLFLKENTADLSCVYYVKLIALLLVGCSWIIWKTGF